MPGPMPQVPDAGDPAEAHADALRAAPALLHRRGKVIGWSRYGGSIALYVIGWSRYEGSRYEGFK